MQLLFRGKPILKCAVAALLSVLLLAAIELKAAPAAAMTQMELIQWLVQLSGDQGALPANPTPQDYVNWANNQGLTPTGGWDTSAELSRDALAQVLLQFFGYSVKPGNDPYRFLKREGIDLGDKSNISRDFWITLVMDSGLVTTSAVDKEHWSDWTPPPNHPVLPGEHQGWNGGNEPPGQQKPKPWETNPHGK